MLDEETQSCCEMPGDKGRVSETQRDDLGCISMRNEVFVFLDGSFLHAGWGGGLWRCVVC